MAALFPTSLRLPGWRAGAPVHWVSALVWAGLAASVVYWGLKLFTGSRPLPAGVVVVGEGATAQGDPQKLFVAAKPVGAAEPAASPASSRFKLIGVVAPAVATLSIDGGPARSYRVGATLVDDWVLRRISQQGVDIGSARASSEQAPAVSLPLPGLPSAARGVPGVTGAAPTVVPAPAGPMMAVPSTPNPGGMPMPGAEGQPLVIEPPAAGLPGRARPRADASVSASASPSAAPAASAQP